MNQEMGHGPVSASITAVLGLLDMSATCEYRARSFSKDAPELWSPTFMIWMGSASPPRTLVLIGDEITHEHTDILDYLAALVLRHRHRESASERRNWSVVALVSDQQRKTAKAAALAGIGNVRILGFADIHLLTSAIVSSLNASPASDESLAILAAVWRDSLTAPSLREDRHSVANQVSARLLARATGRPSTRQQTLPLEVLLDRIGLARLGHSSETPWITREQWQPFIRRIVLVDDMADAGWADMIRAALDADSMIVCRDPFRETTFSGKTLSEALNEKVRTLTESAIRSGFEFVDEGGDARGDLLFLDLRLFGDRLEAEQQFLLELVRLARLMLTASMWQTRDGPALERLETALTMPKDSPVADFRKSTDYDLALSLLPRLIATIDPSLPIIIFSSTQSRHISERLAHHPSIVQSFRKPSFFSGSGDIVSEAQGLFAQAVRSCLPFAELRCFLRRLTRHDAGQSRKRQYLDVYIDESGNPAQGERFAVGGLAVAYDRKDTITDFASRLHTQQLLWGPDDYAPMAPSLVPKLANEIVEESVLTRLHDDVLKGLEGQPPLDVDIIAFGLTMTDWFTPTFTSSLELDALDFAYHQMLAVAVELILFGVADALAPIEVRVDAETRSADLRATESEGVAISNFGLQVRPGDNGPCYESLDTNMVLPLLQWIASERRPDSKPAWKLARARGVSLGVKKGVVKNRDVRRLPSQLHYLADWVARWVAHSRVPDRTEDWFQRGFRESLDGGLQDLLESGRAAARGDYTTAILRFARYEQDRAGDVPQWTIRNAALWAQMLSADQIGELAIRYPARIL